MSRSVCKNVSKWRKVPQFDGDLTLNISHKNVSYDKKSYTTTNGMDWIFSLTLLFCSRFWFLKICHRDFCQTYWEIFENWDIMKIDHFLGHFSTRYIQIWQKKEVVLTISMDKWKKCTSQIFDFWKFVTEIFAKHIERFLKIEK